MNGDKEFYISIDVEADGPIPGENSMLQLGAAAFDGKSETPLGLFCENLMLLDGARQDRDTMKWWLAEERVAIYQSTRVNVQKPDHVMRNFVTWVEMHAKKLDKKPVVVGYPVTYDFMFAYWYTIRFVGRSPFGFQGLDMKTLAAAMLETDFREASKRNFPKPWMMNLPPHTHNALEDAVEQGVIFTRMLRTLNEDDGVLKPTPLKPV